MIEHTNIVLFYSYSLQFEFVVFRTALIETGRFMCQVVFLNGDTIGYFYYLCRRAMNIGCCSKRIYHFGKQKIEHTCTHK